MRVTVKSQQNDCSVFFFNLISLKERVQYKPSYALTSFELVNFIVLWVCTLSFLELGERLNGEEEGIGNKWTGKKGHNIWWRGSRGGRNQWRKIMKTKQDVVIEKAVKDEGKNDTSRTLISVLHHFLAYFVFEDCLLCVLKWFPY